jgi:uncharacterized membrane protein
MFLFFLKSPKYILHSSTMKVKIVLKMKSGTLRVISSSSSSYRLHHLRSIIIIFDLNLRRRLLQDLHRQNRRLQGRVLPQLHPNQGLLRRSLQTHQEDLLQRQLFRFFLFRFCFHSSAELLLRADHTGYQLRSPHRLVT